MASLLNQLSLAFLLFLASSSLQIHARESRFLMRAARPEEPKEAGRIPEETPAVKTEETSNLPPVRSLGGSGYGLYGRGQEQFTPTTTANYNNNNYNYYNSNARPNANTFPSDFPAAELTSENYENKGGYNYGYENKGGYSYGNQFNNANSNPSKFPTEEFNSRSYETKEFNNNYNKNNNYVANNEQHGMSDTRFVENGKYYYDVNADRNRNQYETYPTRGNPEPGARVGNYGNGVYENANANYQYNNGMGYQNNYQGNQESQEKYVP